MGSGELSRLWARRAAAGPRGCGSMVERELPKLETGVRFPSPALFGAGLLFASYAEIDDRSSRDVQGLGELSREPADPIEKVPPHRLRQRRHVARGCVEIGETGRRDARWSRGTHAVRTDRTPRPWKGRPTTNGRRSRSRSTRASLRRRGRSPASPGSRGAPLRVATPRTARGHRPDEGPDGSQRTPHGARSDGRRSPRPPHRPSGRRRGSPPRFPPRYGPWAARSASTARMFAAGSTAIRSTSRGANRLESWPVPAARSTTTEPERSELRSATHATASGA